jgi:phage shock protein PspC (stress-responsive transcriptional regulator)
MDEMNIEPTRRDELKPEPTRRLYRSRQNRMLYGVAGGVAEYMSVDPTLVRVVWILGGLLLFPMGGPLIAVLLYAALAVVIPPAPETY